MSLDATSMLSTFAFRIVDDSATMSQKQLRFINVVRGIVLRS